MFSPAERVLRTNLIHHYGLYDEELPGIDIFDTSLFNKVFQQIFIFFIFLRLWILKNPYKFIFFNFILTIFLIFNEFFLFASFFSFIIILSRLSLFASDYTPFSFYESINIVEKINPNTEFIESCWENAVLIALIVTRNFSEHFPEESLFSKDINICRSVYTRYIQLNESFKNDSNEDSSYINFSLRNAIYTDFIQSNGEIGAPYRAVLKIKKKKKLFANVPYWGVILPIWFPEFLKHRGTFKWYNNATKSNIFDDFNMPHLNETSKNHPVSYALSKNLVIRLNETTPKESSDRSFLALLPTFTQDKLTGRGIMRTCPAKKVNEETAENLKLEIEKKVQTKEIKEFYVSNNFIPNFISTDINPNILAKESLLTLRDLHAEKNLYIFPEFFFCVLAVFDPTSNKEQSIQAMELGLEYLNLQMESKYWNTHQKIKFSKLYIIIKNALNDVYTLSDDAFGDGSNLFLKYKMFLLQESVNAIIENPNTPPVKLIEKVVKNIAIQENPEYFVELNFSNCNHINKQFGGKDKITHKGLFPNLYKSGTVISRPLPISAVTPSFTGSQRSPSTVISSSSSEIVPFNSFPDDPSN